MFPVLVSVQRSLYAAHDQQLVTDTSNVAPHLIGSLQVQKSTGRLLTRVAWDMVTRYVRVQAFEKYIPGLLCAILLLSVRARLLRWCDRNATPTVN